VVVRELYAKLGVKVDPKGASAASNFFSELHHGLQLVAEAGNWVKEKLTEIVGETVGYAKEVKRMSLITGASKDEVQGLMFAAKESGVEVGALQRSLVMLARRGAADPAKSMMQLADQLSKMPEGGARTRLAFQMLGRGGAELVPMLAKGSKGISEMIEEARDLGVIMSEDDLKAADDLNKGMKKWHATMEGLTRQIAGPVIRALVPLLKHVNAWVRANKEIIAAKIERAIYWIGAALEAVWNVLKLGWKLLQPIIVAWEFWSKILGDAFMPIMLSLVALTWALLSPWTLLAVVIALVADDINNFLEGNESMIGLIIAKLERLWKAFEGDTSINWKDHPILSFLRTMLEMLSAISHVAYTALALPYDLIFGEKGAAKKRILEQAKWMEQHDPLTKALDYATAAPTMGGEDDILARGVKSIYHRFGGGASPEATAAIGGGQSVAPGIDYNPNVNITVNAQTGASADDIAGHVGRVIDDRLENHARDIRDFTTLASD
jgi:hypothetical protein